MQLSRSSGDAEAARRRLATLADGLDGGAAAQGGGSALGGPERSARPTAALLAASSEAASRAAATRAAATRAAATGPGRHAARPLTRRSRLLDGLLDQLPASVRGRWGITTQHVTVTALLVATALALAAWWVVRAQPEPVDAVPIPTASTVPAASPGAGTPMPGAAAPTAGAAATTAASSNSAALVVHVAGKVKRPGIVTLPAGSRVIDAVQKAGGARRGVDLSGLNLARQLADGEQILVGAPAVAGAGPPPAGTAVPGQPTGVVNLNTATSEQLETLPGVGPVTAASILEWRAEHGRFSTVEELLEVSGIGEATLADLRELVTV